MSQNNGLIQLTGVGSRYVGYYVAVILAVLGLFPIVGGVLNTLPTSSNKICYQQFQYSHLR